MQLQTFLRSLVRFLCIGLQAETMLPFKLRELSQNGQVVEVLCDRIVGPMHAWLCRIWAATTGQDTGNAAVRLRVFSLIGQALYFRVGAPNVSRRLTIVMITLMALTRETERGTMENLRSMPVAPIEIILGKVLPYFFVGAVLVILGYGISNLARRKVQAMRLAVFYFLPSLPLSGFMFPYRGMPNWARRCLGRIFCS